MNFPANGKFILTDRQKTLIIKLRHGNPPDYYGRPLMSFEQIARLVHSNSTNCAKFCYWHYNELGLKFNPELHKKRAFRSQTHDDAAYGKLFEEEELVQLKQEIQILRKKAYDASHGERIENVRKKRKLLSFVGSLERAKLQHRLTSLSPALPLLEDKSQREALLD